MSLWELAAVVLAIAYLLLAIKQNALCWLAAIASAAIYVVLLFEVRLYMESALQLFYIAMAIYGWVVWRRSDQRAVQVSSWPLAFHFIPLLIIVLLTLASATALKVYTDAVSPWLDSFVTWGSIVTTWMVARKILQNWHYWFVIDTISVYLYVSRDLWLTAGLFVVYLILIVLGYRQWRSSMRAVA